MKQFLENHLRLALDRLKKERSLDADLDAPIQLDRTKQAEHGDYASNVALIYAKRFGMAPRALAELLVNQLDKVDEIREVQIAGPGFINFYLADAVRQRVVAEVLTQGAAYGRSDLGQGKRVHLEYVSANPTGPLHVGHGRAAAYGSVLTNILRATGFEVHGEYYVNDAGRQMHILAASIWLRYLELCGETIKFPSNGYKGSYVKAIAASLKAQHDRSYCHEAAAVFADVPPDADESGGDKEAHIDGLVQAAQQLLGEAVYQEFFDAGLNTILADIQDDLQEFGVCHDEWFSERDMMLSGVVQRGLEYLEVKGYTYEQDGATWFKAAEFGDEKDRVLVRANGQTTYFASDVAYHYNKYERGYDVIVNILGADHHGYAPRLKAVIQALGLQPEQFSTPLIQFVSLYRAGEKVQMSTRSGSFVTLRELREEVGNDAARFFYVMRKREQHLDFDLDLAKSRSNENPVFYVQYAHARICSVEQQMAERNVAWNKQAGLENLHWLREAEEDALLRCIAQYPELVANAATNYEPHLLVHYLRELAQHFHAYYNAHQFIVEGAPLCNARLCLIMAVKQVLHNGLELLGVTAPERM